MRIFLLLFSFLVFSGCVSSKPELDKESETLKYPAWYTSLHKDSTLYYYGLGEGSSKKDATASALNDIASKISISVESTYVTKTKIVTKNQKEDYTQIIDSHIKNEVSKIEFNSYEVQKYEKLNNDTHVVMVVLKRIKSAEFKSQKIKTKIDSYKKELASKNANVVAKLKALNEMLYEMQTKTLPECYVVKTLYSNEDIEDDIKTIFDIESKISNFKDSVTFSVNGEKGYKETLVDKISSKGFSVIQSNPKVNVNVKADETKLQVMGNHIYKAKLTITASVKNKTVGKKTLTIGAKSRTSYEQAKEFALVEFIDRLEEQNVLEELVGI